MRVTDFITQYKNTSPIIIGVSGGSCSGKTTLARKIYESCGPENCLLILQDNYYIDQSHRFDHDGGEVNFDHPSSLDFLLMAAHIKALKSGQSIEIPIYDFVTHTRLEKKIKGTPKKFIVIDGTLILSQDPIRHELHESIFLDIHEELRFERRKRRDTVERGRSLEGVVSQLINHVKPMHDQFVAPSSQHSKYLFETNEEADLFMEEFLKNIKELIQLS